MKFSGERLIPEVNYGAAFYYEHLARYYFAAQFCKRKAVLDIACGTGYGSQILKLTGKATQVTGVDISKTTIKYATQKFGHKDIAFIADDATQQTKIAKLKFDVIVSFETIEHLKKQADFINLCVSKLNDKGLFIVSTPNALTYPKGNKFHLRELEPADFIKLLKKYFSHIEILSQKYYLTQIIQREQKTTKHFTRKKGENFIKPGEIEDCEYLIAICSNSPLPKITTVTMSASKVDNFDLTQGMLSLSRQFSELYNRTNELSAYINKIHSSKMYRWWQKISHFKRQLLKLVGIKTPS